MISRDFEIVRDMKAGRSPAYRNHRPAPGPSSFREIDGNELARQYVAHRSLKNSEPPSKHTDPTGIMQMRMQDPSRAAAVSKRPSLWTRLLGRW